MRQKSRNARRLLILGATGMAGHVVSTHLGEEGHQVTRAARQGVGEEGWLELDVSRDDDLTRVVRTGGYDAIVNCVGTLVADSESHPEQAILLNAYLPRRLEALTASTATRVIHLSTDCVFSGSKGGYLESSFRDGDSTYDRAKALGELNNPKDLTLRMSIIGPEIRASGTGLMHWFLGQTGEVTGYAEAMWNGITTLELAKAISAVIEEGLTGLYHLVPPQSISKHDLLAIIREVFERGDIRLRADHTVAIDKTLVDSRQEAPYRVGIGGYESMIKDVREWINAHPELYEGDLRYALNVGVGGMPS
jgi:dTDP-4-dehydrorhamnose reductase